MNRHNMRRRKNVTQISGADSHLQKQRMDTSTAKSVLTKTSRPLSSAPPRLEHDQEDTGWGSVPAATCDNGGAVAWDATARSGGLGVHLNVLRRAQGDERSRVRTPCCRNNYVDGVLSTHNLPSNGGDPRDETYHTIYIYI